MSRLRFDPTFTDRERAWGAAVATVLWIVSYGTLLGLMTWSMKYESPY